MNHIRSSSLYSGPSVQPNATEDSELCLAFSQMADGIKKPADVAWKLYDARRGRVKDMLGSWGWVSLVLAHAGASYSCLSRPVIYWLAKLRRICNQSSSESLGDATIEAKCVSDEAEVCAFRLAHSMNSLGASDLLTLEKEAAEAAEKWGQVEALAADRLIALTEGK